MCKTLKDLKVYPIELTREQRIKQVAYLIVTGELLNTEQGISIILQRAGKRLKKNSGMLAKL